MSAQPPPSMLWQPLGLWIPGLWDFFLSHANRALADSGATPTSWWRSVRQNRELGGAEESQHLLGLALDLVGGVNTAAAFSAQGFVVVVESDHVHAQTYPAGVLGQAGVYRALGLSTGISV